MYVHVADWAAISYTDAQIGKVLASLDAAGFADETVVCPASSSYQVSRP
jgi:arylsulfatase A-like enzyme